MVKNNIRVKRFDRAVKKARQPKAIISKRIFAFENRLRVLKQDMQNTKIAIARDKKRLGEL